MADMQENMPSTFHIVLAGAGHAHLHLVANAAMLNTQHVRLTLIDPGDFWYSGRASAMLGGSYDAPRGRIDTARLAQAHNVAHHSTALSQIHPHQRYVTLSDGSQLPYHRLSLNTGSRISLAPPFDSAEKTAIRLWPVKPIDNLLTLHQALTQRLVRGEVPRLAVIGGGATGIEIAANLDALCRRLGKTCPIMLIGRQPRLLPQAPAGASCWIQRHLAKRGVQVLLDRKVTTLDRHTIGGRNWSLPVDDVVLATGLTPSLSYAPSSLPVCREGLCVNETLQSTGDAHVFAAGDCAAIRNLPLPKLGVHGVRQAPLLLENLLASLRGNPMHRYRPASQALQILDLGDGYGLALRGKYWWPGRLSLIAKHHIDERFLRRYRA
ncbi:NAD(P)/FAD-dependent oxidoreductase [Halomonas sp. WWR20]